MTVGLPGTGIGGLFYLCLVAWMPVNELWQAMRGRSSVARWGRIAYHWVIVAGIWGALWAEAWLLMKLLEKWAGLRADHDAARFAWERVMPKVGQWGAEMSFATLGAVLISIHVARVALRLWRARTATAGAGWWGALTRRNESPADPRSRAA